LEKKKGKKKKKPLVFRNRNEFQVATEETILFSVGADESRHNHSQGQVLPPSPIQREKDAS
jgi:hypothetical protein